MIGQLRSIVEAQFLNVDRWDARDIISYGGIHQHDLGAKGCRDVLRKPTRRPDAHESFRQGLSAFT